MKRYAGKNVSSMMKKGAIELSMNMLVGIILGIVLLGSGLAFAFSIFNTANKLIEDPGVPSVFDSMAKECIQKGEQVCVPEIKKTIPIGKTMSFGVVINNVVGSQKNFKPNVRFSKAILEDETELDSIKESDWIWPDDKFRELGLKDREDYTLSVPIRVPGGVKSGTYIFNINICFDSDSNKEPGKCPDSQYPSLYGTTSQVRVIVP